MTISAGGTVAYISYEIQQGAPGADGAAEDDAARDEALAHAANPLAHIYAAMTDQEIAAVRNWPHPQPTAVISAPPRKTWSSAPRLDRVVDRRQLR